MDIKYKERGIVERWEGMPKESRDTKERNNMNLKVVYKK
jgi:hypothetical protein